MISTAITVLMQTTQLAAAQLMAATTAETIPVQQDTGKTTLLVAAPTTKPCRHSKFNWSNSLSPVLDITVWSSLHGSVSLSALLTPSAQELGTKCSWEFNPTLSSFSWLLMAECLTLFKPTKLISASLSTSTCSSLCKLVASASDICSPKLLENS